MSGIQKDFSPNDLQIVEVAFDEMASYLPNFIAEFRPNFPVGSAPGPSIHEFMQHPTIQRFLVPQMMFIDRQGTIRSQHAAEEPMFGPEEAKLVKEEIEMMVKAPAPKAAKPALPARKRAAAK